MKIRFNVLEYEYCIKVVQRSCINMTVALVPSIDLIASPSLKMINIHANQIFEEEEEEKKNIIMNQ